MELYKKYRPTDLSGLAGQSESVTILKVMLAEGVPHAILLTGPSGCGKTTTARILKKHLGCSDHDFREINAADSRGIDTIREIRERMHLAPMGGDSRIYLIDECHALTGPSQQAMLKMLEDTPKHVYFILATTDPQKLITTIKTRCTEVRFKPLDGLSIAGLIALVAKKEKIKVHKEAAQAIVEAAEGSARKALVLLQTLQGVEGEDEQVAVINKNSSKAGAIELARELFSPRPDWSKVAKVLKDVADEDAEGIRYLVLGYARSILLGGGKLAGRAYQVIQVFRDNLFDSKHAGLAANCWEIVKGG